MTRQEFIESDMDLSELISFMYDNELDNILESIHHRDERNEYIDKYVRDNIYSYGWEDIMEFLNKRYEEGDYKYYEEDECGIYVGLDEYSCDDMKSRIIETMDYDNSWDEPEEDESQDETYESDTIEEITDDIDELIGETRNIMSNVVLVRRETKTVSEESVEEYAEAEFEEEELAEAEDMAIFF